MILHILHLPAMIAQQQRKRRVCFQMNYSIVSNILAFLKIGVSLETMNASSKENEKEKASIETANEMKKSDVVTKENKKTHKGN
jgi:hypothetical protein